MAISARASTTSSNAGSASITIALPSGVADHDVLVAAFTADNNPSVTAAPSGWSQALAAQPVGTSAELYVYYHVVASAASEPSSFTWSLDSSQKWNAGMTAFTGVDNTTVWDAPESTADGSGSNVSSLTVPGLTTVTDGAMLIGGVGVNAGSVSVTPPSGWTEAFASVGQQDVELAYKLIPTAGATGSATWTYSVATRSVAFMRPLRPGATGTPVTVAGVLATAAATAPAGSVTAARSVTLPGPLASATAAGPAGSVQTTSSVTVAGPLATAAASAPGGAVSLGHGVALVGPLATVSATAPDGSVTTAGGVTLTAPVAAVTATAPNGTVQTGTSVTLAGPVASAQTLALAGNVSADAILAGALATVTAAAPAGHFGSVPILPHQYAHAALATDGTATAALAAEGTSVAVLAANGQATVSLVAPLATVTLHTED